MTVVPAAVDCSFEVTFDQPSLPVAMSVYDDSSGSPVLVQGPTAMDNVVANTYRGKFIPTVGKVYLIFKAVYTDGGFGTINTDFPQGSETVYAGVVGTPAPIIQQIVSLDLDGILDDGETLLGEIEDENENIGGLLESDDELL